MSKPARARRAARVRRNQGSPSRFTGWLLWGGIAAAAVVIVGIVAALNSTVGAPTRARDFHMVAYQGQEVLGGDEVDFSRLFGPERQKPVVLNFWAGLCPPCRAEMPGFQRVYDDLDQRFTLVGVDIGPYTRLGTHDDARQFLQEYDIRYPAAYATSDPTRLYAIQGMPTTLLFEPDGTVFYRRTGYFPEEEFRSKLQDLLAASS